VTWPGRLGSRLRDRLRPERGAPAAPGPAPAPPGGGTGGPGAIERRDPVREVLDRALVTPGRQQPGRRYSGEAWAADGRLSSLSLRPSARAGFKHVPLAPGRPAVRLAGHHLYAGPLFGIFGHDLVELPGRLWPLLHERFDGIVVQKFKPGTDAFQLKVDHTIATVLDAFGIGFRDIHVVEAPTEVERLTVPEPALYINDFGLPVLGDCFRRIAARYRADPIFDGRGFYLSRTQAGSSRVANEAELEAAARRAGLQVLHPQLCALPMQIALMAGAGTLAGTDGSALHLAAFAAPGTRLLYVDTRDLANQRILNAVAGLDATCVRVPPGGTVADPERLLQRFVGGQ
jgi:Glycosyltransferase 61